MRSSWFLLIAALATSAACSRQPTDPCQPDTRYATARSAPPVQIPDDLSPPNETNALRLPDVAAGGAGSAGGCLDTPPPFFGEERPFLSGAGSDDDRKSRREARREERRQRRGETPAEQPAAPPERSDPAPSDDDRVIDN